MTIIIKHFESEFEIRIQIIIFFLQKKNITYKFLSVLHREISIVTQKFTHRLQIGFTTILKLLNSRSQGYIIKEIKVLENHHFCGHRMTGI